MKILVSVLVFVTALTLGVQSLANESEGHGKAEAERDMSTLFPYPKADLSLGERPAKPELESPTFFQKI